MLDAEYPSCKECGAPAPTHNSACSVSIKDRNAEISRLRASHAELLAALRWAFSLAQIIQENHRQHRLQAGHDDICGTRPDGTQVIGLWQNEIDAESRAAKAIVNAEKV